MDFVKSFPYVRVLSSIMVIVGLVEGNPGEVIAGIFVLCLASAFNHIKDQL